MRAWFQSLQERERYIVIGGAIVAVIIVLWMLVLTPLRGQSSDLRESVTEKQRLLIDIGRVEALGPTGPVVAVESQQQSLVVLVDNTAQAYGLALPRTRPDGSNGINVSFQSVSFDALLNWLITLETTHGVSVESASFTSASERGLVNGQLFLRRS